MPDGSPLHLRIFVSSPGDVPDERSAARELIDTLPRRPFFADDVTLQFVGYDDPYASTPMAAGETPQVSVNRYKSMPSECDLTVVILWSKIGTPLPADQSRPDGTPYESGTVWEYEDALAAGREVWVYRRTEEPRYPAVTPAEYQKLWEQNEAVKSFVAGFRNPDTSIARGCTSYQNPTKFRELLEQHLEAFIKLRLKSCRPNGSGPVEIRSLVQGENNTLCITYTDDTQRTVPFLVGTPAPDHLVVGRAPLVDALWRDLAQIKPCKKALVFLPGVGKTTVAVELVHDVRRVLSIFQGVLWANLGRTPDILRELWQWAYALEVPAEEMEKLDSAEARKARIKVAIGGRRLLVVLDDVWQKEDADLFMQLGRNCSYIITTRSPEIALQLDGDKTIVGELDENEGLTFLESISQAAVAYDRKRALALVRAVGGLPQALVLSGKLLRAAADSGNPRDLDAAYHRFEEGTELSLAQIIKVSYDALDSDEEKNALNALSILRPKPRSFPEAAALAIAGCGTGTLDRLTKVGLLESRYNLRRSEAFYTMHPVIAEFALRHLGRQESTALHRKALDYYAGQLAGMIDDDPLAYQSWYRYEKPDWQSVKDAWMYHLARTGADRVAFLAFLRVYFDAFWWWGYYQRFPFCERLIREWRQRNIRKEAKAGLDQLAVFDESYPAGYEKRGKQDQWRKVETALTTVGKMAGLAGVDPCRLKEDDARQVRGFIDFFLAEAYAYGGGERTSALARYDTVSDLFQRNGNRWVAGWIEFYVANYLQEHGDDVAARERCQWSLKLADETQPLEKRDPEILANVYRLLGDLDTAADDWVAAVAHYRRAAFYAYAFQGIPEPPDPYTNDFYREITGRIAETVLTLYGKNAARAVALCENMREFFLPVRESLGIAPPAEPISAALESGSKPRVVADLFPPDIPDELVAARAADYQAQVLRTVRALQAVAFA